jgi:hypothetical protein
MESEKMVGSTKLNLLGEAVFRNDKQEIDKLTKEIIM